VRRLEVLLDHLFPAVLPLGEYPTALSMSVRSGLRMNVEGIPIAVNGPASSGAAK